MAWAAEAAGDAGKLGTAFPDGLAFRVNLPAHLRGPEGFKGGKLFGTHNQDFAVTEIQARGGTYSLTPTSTPGISEMTYQVVNPNTGKPVADTKTVYNPAVHSDQKMLELSLKAGERAFEAYKLNSTVNRYDFIEGGVNLRSYININQATGTPYIGNVHPIK